MQRRVLDWPDAFWLLNWISSLGSIISLTATILFIVLIQNAFILKRKTENFQNKENFKEDRKDKRTEKQATQQSKMISQRKENLPPTNFEEEEEEVPNPMENMLQNMNQKNML